jgi:hypothetical protein
MLEAIGLSRMSVRRNFSQPTICERPKFNRTIRTRITIPHLEVIIQGTHASTTSCANHQLGRALISLPAHIRQPPL